MRNSLAILIALALPACSVGPVEDDSFGRADTPDSPDSDATNPDDPADPTDNEVPADDDGDDDDVDDEQPDDPDTTWDNAAPEVEDGTTVTFDLSCGLLEDTTRKTWQKNGDVWDEVFNETAAVVGPHQDLMPCFDRDAPTGPDKFLTWDEDGFIYIESAGLAHDNRPTPTDDFWLGEVYPHADPSPQCIEALAGRGLSFPVPMSLKLVEILEPGA